MAAPIRQLFPEGVPPAEEAPNPQEIVPTPADPLAVARVLLQDPGLVDEQGRLLLRKWRGDFMRYVGPHWVPADPESVRKWLYERLEHAEYEKVDPKTGQVELKPWAPDKSKLDRLTDALIPPTLVDRDVEPPTWLSSGESAAGLVPCLNGLVDVHTQRVLPASADYWGTVAIPLEFDPDVEQPVEWLRFLRTLWPAQPFDSTMPEDEQRTYIWWQAEDGTWWRDADEIRTLRQWFGYVLSGRLDLQKMLLLVGPPRSGKGTIARLLRALVGEANTSAPTLAGMAQNFGLETSIGKTLMVVGDARLQSQGQEAVVERLLSISGQDAITLDRKNRTAWTGTMQARVMILSNELPKFGDASGAIASRFVIVKLEESFLGREDTDLEHRLRGELPAILKWALDGLVDLNTTRRIVEPPAHLEALQEMYDLVSPISSFIRDVCDTADPNATVPFADLYREYGTWCSENGRGQAATARFSADLKARMPGLKTDHRPRDAAGRKMPRHVRGLAIGTEWRNRVKPAGQWPRSDGQ